MVNPESSSIRSSLTIRLGQIAQLNEDQLLQFERQFIVTAGFTIDNLDQLLEELDGAGPEEQGDEDDFVKVLGWIFSFPGHSLGKIVEISVERMVMRTSLAQTVFTKEAFTQSVELSPKIFFQRKAPEVTTESLLYPNAFDATQPRFIVDNELPVSLLEDYQDWIELTYLSRSDLENFVYLLNESAAQYNDLFFSGARIRYATMHNPQLRLEQLTLMNPHTNQIVGLEANFPFTLKGEPYVGAADNDFLWLRSQLEPDSALPPVLSDLLAEADTPPKLGESILPEGDAERVVLRNNHQTAAAGASEFPPPSSAMMVPCPPLWEIGEATRESLLRVAPNISQGISRQVEKDIVQLLETAPADLSTQGLIVDYIDKKIVTPSTIVEEIDNSFLGRLRTFIRAFFALFRL